MLTILNFGPQNDAPKYKSENEALSLTLLKMHSGLKNE